MVAVIICLGDVFKPRNMQFMKWRVEKAVGLYKQGLARKIIFTGGFKTRKDLSEARFMANHAIEQSIKEIDIILEEKANTTIGNAVYSKRIMDKRRYASAIVVTSPHHIRRATYIFSKVMQSKELLFEKSAGTSNVIESFRLFLGEYRGLLKIMREGIDLAQV